MLLGALVGFGGTRSVEQCKQWEKSANEEELRGYMILKILFT